MTTRFDTALLEVSNFLADARILEQSGNTRHAAIAYSVAESYAVRTGFLELIHLVWAYIPCGTGRAYSF